MEVEKEEVKYTERCFALVDIILRLGNCPFKPFAHDSRPLTRLKSSTKTRVFIRWKYLIIFV